MGRHGLGPLSREAALAIGLAATLLPACPAPASLAFRQSEVEAPGPAGPLRGTMLAPVASPAPVVLIIPGSGPVDRDGNIPGALSASTYKLLAAGLAANGVASVRIDKRGLYGSRAAVADANAVTIGGYADDVRAWVTAIRSETGASCVWLLGHSEGGLVALVASGKTADVCGLVLVATPGRPLGEVLRAQLTSNPTNAPILHEALAAIDALETGGHVDGATMNPLLLPLFRPQVQDFLIDEFSYDPAKLIAANHRPVLILQGDKDLQVGVDDARRLALAHPRAKLVVSPSVNHVLKMVTSPDRAANYAAYTEPDLPLAEGIIDAIAGFVVGPTPRTDPRARPSR